MICYENIVDMIFLQITRHFYDEQRFKHNKFHNFFHTLLSWHNIISGNIIVIWDTTNCCQIHCVFRLSLYIIGILSLFCGS